MDGAAAALTVAVGGGEGMNDVVVLLIGLVAGLIVGFIIGRYGKILWRMLMNLIKATPRQPSAPDNGEADAIHDPDGEDDEEDADKLKEMISTFLDAESTPGIDDNPNIEFNPIFDYLIKRQKEQERLEFAKKRAEEEGMDFEDGGDNQAIDTGGKANALQILIKAGAQTTSVRTADNAAAVAAQEARRKMKNIEVFLSKAMGVDTSVTKREPGKRMTTKPVLNVYEKAMDTATHPAQARAVATALTAARQSRRQLQSILKQRPELNKPQPEEPVLVPRQRGNGGVDVRAELLAMHDELQDLADAEDEEDEEDDEDEEASVDADDLAA